MSKSSKEYDLVIYGATGFTGKLASEYVFHHYHNKIRYALAGRSLSKLESLRNSLGDANIPLLQADALDPAALEKMAASTLVIANYAGTPFLDKALPLVEACCKHGTCYTDITGEVPLHFLSYKRYHKLAEKSRSLIIHSTGYDSIPSDVGAMLAAEAMQKRHGCKCQSIRLVTGKSRGGISGGTLHTGMSLKFGPADQPGVQEAKTLGCYSLDPEGADRGPDTFNTVSFVEYDNVSGNYVAPFVMAGANAPVVRKTNALTNYKYGRDCSYSEVSAVPNWFVGAALAIGLRLFDLVMAFTPFRLILLNTILPKPGEGPSKKVRETGVFESKTYAIGDSSEKPVTVAYVKSGSAGDPGYKATAQMSIEASLCMALQRDKCYESGGVVTPVVGLGQCLIDRLNQSGMEFGVEE